MDVLAGIMGPAMIVSGLFPVTTHAQEAWLVTYGPGADVWERFGHNALWIRDERTGLDHTYSFGYFDLDREGFYVDYARGVMRYYGAASAADREFAFYRGRERGIRAQRLDLDPGQVRGLHAMLDSAIYPAPRYYDYDYYFANCSTWLRDLIDTVTGGGLAAGLDGVPAAQNLRDHTRRLTQERFWLHTGIMLALGAPVDAPNTAWQEMFLPQAVADWLDGVEIDGRPLVVESVELYRSPRFAPPDRPGGLWPKYLLLGLASAALILLPVRLQRRGRAGMFAWSLVNGVAGAVLMFLWLGSAHAATSPNAVVLLLNPVWWVLPWNRGGRSGVAVWWMLAAATAAGAVLLVFPQGFQFRGEQLLWLVPANLAALAAWRLTRR